MSNLVEDIAEDEFDDEIDNSRLYKTCVQACQRLNVSCPNCECRNWMDFEEDLNCAKICAEKNGPLTLREVSVRAGCTFVGVKQIQDRYVRKMKLIYPDALEETI